MNLTMEIGEKLGINEEIKAKRRRVVSFDSESVVVDRQLKRTLLCVAKPSYLLGLGPKVSQRSEYLNGLPRILRELLRQKKWRDASRVLSVLMQGTMRDGSPNMNRLKYEAQIRILSHLQLNKNNAEEIGDIYDTWIGKIGKEHKEERLLVWYEQICHFINHGMDDEAYSAVISMMQNRDMGTLPRSNLFIGMTFHKIWCRKFLVELQPKNAEDCIASISEMSEARSDIPVGSPAEDMSFYTAGSEASAIKESEISVMNYKKVSHMSISDSGTEMDTKVKLERPQHVTNPPRLYATSEENEASLQDGVAHAYDPALVKILDDMDSWLLPLKPPEDPNRYINMLNDSYYKEAVKYLRLAVQSPLHVSLAALHPLVQLLLIGGHVDEAMKVVEEICNKVHDIKPIRIKAAMLEKFHPHSEMVAKCYEDILKIDPRCKTTLKKLIKMSIEDGYSRESLIEMIALHVEASYPEPVIWKEFASCFLHFFEDLDEDRMSVCLNSSGQEGKQHRYSVRYNPTPKMFTNTISGPSWTLRAKWWLHHHFSPDMLETEIKTGDLEMMSYKAACASHIYGREFSYVTKVYDFLEGKKNINRDLFILLRKHRQNWNMIYNPDC